MLRVIEPAKVAPFLNARFDIFSRKNLLRCENFKIIHRRKGLVLMIKRKQGAKRGRRKGRRVPPAHGVIPQGHPRTPSALLSSRGCRHVPRGGRKSLRIFAKRSRTGREGEGEGSLTQVG